MPHNFNLFPELTNNQMQFYYLQSPHRQITESFIARVSKVIDGDTIRVKWTERDFDFPVRFININAPEMSNGGGESKKWLENQIADEEVYIKVNPRDRVGKWGRILGEVFHMGINMNEMSLQSGMAFKFGEEQLW